MRGQRDAAEARISQLASDLRDAIYSLSQLHAAQQDPAAAWALRGLASAATQTQHCELWEANLVAADYIHARLDGKDGSEGGSVLWADHSASEAGSRRRSSGGDTHAEPGLGEIGGGAGTAGSACKDKLLPLPALQQLVRDVYRGKAQQDIAVARGQRPFQPLREYVAAYLAQQYGAEGPAVQQRTRQLQASVAAHAGVREVGLFGLAAGLLWEAAPGDAHPANSPHAVVLGSAAAGQSSYSRHAHSAAATAVPLVLYHSRRVQGAPAKMCHSPARAALRCFCAAAWHAAYLASAARPPLRQPLSFGAGPGSLLHGVAAEVSELALSVPGVEQLAAWVLRGGLGACLPQLDLGLRLAENQAGGEPQLGWWC